MTLLALALAGMVGLAHGNPAPVADPKLTSGPALPWADRAAFLSDTAPPQVGECPGGPAFRGVSDDGKWLVFGFPKTRAIIVVPLNDAGDPVGVIGRFTLPEKDGPLPSPTWSPLDRERHPCDYLGAREGA